MGVYIALLRGINVGGRNMIAMADLRTMLARLGFENGQSLLQSGNLVFESTGKTPVQIEALLEAETQKRLGNQITYVVRSDREWQAVVARNPFPAEAERDPGHLLVQFGKAAPDTKAVKALQAAIVGRERLEADGKQLYVVYPDGVGTSKLTNAVIEKKLGTSMTGRNWNTVLKLAALAASPGDVKKAKK